MLSKSTSSVPFLDLTAQTSLVSTAYLDQLRSQVARNHFVGGAPVNAFETAFADYCGTSQCVALNSGTDALRLGLIAGEIGPEDEVVTSPFTFIATAEAISQTGKLVLADIDPETFTLSPGSVRERMTARTRAIVPVHIFGLPADLQALGDLAAERGLFLLEDACQAHGAAIGERRVGSFGQAGAFSFYPTKNLGAFGDAGCLVCHSEATAERVRLLRNHGQTGPYRHDLEGFNSRMDVFQALVLNLKLPYLESWNQQRRDLVAIYREGLAGVEEIRLQRVPEGHLHAYHIVAALAERRDELAGYLASQGIETRIIYPTPIHLMQAYAHLGLRPGDLPHSEKVCRQVICFPVFPGLPRGSVERTAELVKEFYRGP